MQERIGKGYHNSYSCIETVVSGSEKHLNAFVKQAESICIDLIDFLNLDFATEKQKNFIET